MGGAGGEVLIGGAARAGTVMESPWLIVHLGFVTNDADVIGGPIPGDQDLRVGPAADVEVGDLAGWRGVGVLRVTAGELRGGDDLLGDAWAGPLQLGECAAEAVEVFQ